MNRFLALFIFLFLTTTDIFAKGGFYIQPYMGVGATGVTGVSEIRQRNLFRPTLSANAGINGGKYFGNFRIEVGVGFLTTGYKHRQLPMNSLTGNYVDTVDITVSHIHVMLPVSVGYTFLHKDNISITPSVGAAPVYNAQPKSTWEYYSTGAETKTIYPKQLGNPFPTVSLIGTAAVSFAYQLNERIALTLAPTGYFTITPMTQTPGAYQRNYAITGNIGLQVKL